MLEGHGGQLEKEIEIYAHPLSGVTCDFLYNNKYNTGILKFYINVIFYFSSPKHYIFTLKLY